jgi:hypothetical protein
MKIIEYYGGLPLKIETNFNPFFGKMFQQAYAELVAGEKYCTDLRAELDAERKRVAEIRDELEVAKRVGEAIKKCKSKLEDIVWKIQFMRIETNILLSKRTVQKPEER